MRKSESKRTQERYPKTYRAAAAGWVIEKATQKQIDYIKSIQEAARKIHRYLPFIDYRTATKAEASDYIEKYRKARARTTIIY